MNYKVKELHAITQARTRYGLELNELDLAMIEILIQNGIGKEIIHNWDYNSGSKIYNLRYGGKLIQPVIKELDNNQTVIATFKPTGKRVPWKKHVQSQPNYDYKDKIKRMKMGK